LGHLFLLGSDLFYAAPHDIEIERQGRKLLAPGQEKLQPQLAASSSKRVATRQALEPWL
jgi:hypothetical protein